MKLNNFNELQIYSSIIDGGSLSAAAKQLGLAPTLVSRRLASLESTLGVTLIRRTTRQMHVTPEGNRFYLACQEILGKLNQVEAELSETRQLVEGKLRVMLPTAMITVSLLREFKHFLLEHPALDVDIHISDHPVDPIAGGYDLIAWVGQPPESDHVAKHLCVVKPYLAASPDYAERAGIPRTLAELSQHELLLFSGDRPQEHWALVDGNGEEHLVPVQGHLQSNSSDALAKALYAGIGIGIRPLWEIKEAVAKGQLVSVLPEYHFRAVDVFAVYPGRAHRQARLHAFIEFLREQVPQDGKP